MSVLFVRLAALCYAGGAAAYIVFFARPRHVRVAVAGFWLVSAGVAIHAVSIGFGCAEFGGAEFFGLRGGLGFLAFLAAGAFLAVQRLYALPAVGAFVVPLVLIALIPSVFELGPGVQGMVPEVVRLPTLKLHVSAAIGGVALFAVAFGVALMYLLQEREVKGKHFGALFSRLPPLDSLDRLTQRLVRMGFAVWTVALLSGALVAKNAWGSFWSWDPQQVSALLVWILYGAMVQLRHAGVHGRRYALLTLVGFALVLSFMLGLGAVPNVTRHGGSFQ
jgi:HemX protein